MGFFSLEATQANRQNQLNKRRQNLAERQQRMAEAEQRYRQNPFNTLLQSFAKTAPAAAAQALGNIAVDQVRYHFGGGERQLAERERSARAVEAINRRQRATAERQQALNEYKAVPHARKGLSEQLGFASPKPSSAPPTPSEMKAQRLARQRQQSAQQQTKTLSPKPQQMPSILQLPGGEYLASEEAYAKGGKEIASLSPFDELIEVGEAARAKMGKPKAGLPQDVTFQGKKYRRINKAQFEALNKKMAKTPRQAPTSMATPPPAPSAQQRVQMPPSLDAPLPRGPRAQFGDYDYTTAEERNKIAEAEKNMLTSWSERWNKQATRYLDYAAAPNKNPESYKMFQQGIAESIFALPRSQRRAALAEVKGTLSGLPDDEAAKAWNDFVVTAGGRVGKVSGKLPRRGTSVTVRNPPGVQVANTQKSHTGNILKYDRELKAVNFEIEQEREKGFDPSPELLARQKFLNEEIQFHKNEYNNLLNQPNITKVAGQKNYTLSDGTKFTGADLNVAEVKEFVGQEAFEEQKINEIKSRVRYTPASKLKYIKAIEDSDISNKNNVLNEIDKASPEKQAQIIAETVYYNDLKVGGSPRKPGKTPAKSSALLMSAQSGFRSNAIAATGLKDSATNKEIADKVGITENALNDYLETGSTDSPRKNRKIESFIKKHNETFDVEALETQEVTHPLWTKKLLENNPWAAVEGVKWFRSLPKGQQDALAGAKKGQYKSRAIFENLTKAQKISPEAVNTNN